MVLLLTSTPCVQPMSFFLVWHRPHFPVGVAPGFLGPMVAVKEGCAKARGSKPVLRLTQGGPGRHIEPPESHPADRVIYKAIQRHHKVRSRLLQSVMHLMGCVTCYTPLAGIDRVG